jgi:hypothetical protein
MIGYLADRERKEIRNMVLHCKDVDYFGHFNMAFILRMEGLRELEVWGDGTNVGPWYSNDRHIRTTKADFEEARNKDPGVSICDPPIPYALADACYSVGMSKSETHEFYDQPRRWHYPWWSSDTRLDSSRCRSRYINSKARLRLSIGN